MRHNKSFIAFARENKASFRGAAEPEGPQEKGGSMKATRLTARVFWICAATALMAACGGPQRFDAIPATLDGGSAGARRGTGRGPEENEQNLLYVADPGAGGVIVYTYEPPKYKFVGFLSGASSPAGECVDGA